MGKRKLIYKNISKQIIDSAFQVYDELGAGFIEKVYENAMVLNLDDKELLIEHQKNLQIFY